VAIVSVLRRRERAGRARNRERFWGDTKLEARGNISAPRGVLFHSRTSSTMSEAAMSEVTARLTTTGMHCRSCSMMVDMTVGEIDGVADVRTDHVTGETLVTFDDTQTNVEAIITEIRGAGYDAEPAD
jgi:copper chaperone